ncbi:hypothetical protein R4Z09_26055 [Niallia oryzisoli]|uniref:Uncharacterized protein n=1 Tax=Niallia oryzisoli TaxID=1737571 RepID=A0ABZ2CBK4_9BACI
MIRKFGLFLSLIMAVALITACSSEQKEGTTTASKEEAVNSGTEENEASSDKSYETGKTEAGTEKQEQLKKDSDEQSTSESNNDTNTTVSDSENGNTVQGETIISTDLMNNIGETLHLGYTPEQLKQEFGEPDSVKTTMSEMMLYYSDAVYTVSRTTNQVHLVSVQEGKASSFYENVSDVISTYSESGNWQLNEEIYDDEYHLVVQNSEFYMVFVSDPSASKIKSFWVQEV